MDAQKIHATKGDPSKQLSDAQAVKMALADALRDLADEIENGARRATELQTFESANHDCTISMMHLVTVTPRAK